MISNLGNFIISMFTGLYDIIRIIPAITSTLTVSIGYMPDFLVAFAALTLIVMVIFVIAGRGGASS